MKKLALRLYWALTATLGGSLLFSAAVRADALADPTRPMRAGGVRLPPAVGKLQVEAILISEGRALAIINGTVVRAGDRIGKARIDEILSDGVRYTSDGQSRVSRLDPSSLQVRGTPTPSKDER
jgi:hypothetical protein